MPQAPTEAVPSVSGVAPPAELRKATWSVTENAPKESLLTIWAATRAPNDQSRSEAIRKLQVLGDLAVPLLMEIWQRGSPSDANAVAEAVGKLKPKAEVIRDIFIEDLRSHSKKEIRAAAAVALGKIQDGNEASIDALIAGLQDREPKVVSRSAFALGEIGAPAKKACPDLVALVKRTLKDEGKFEHARDAEVPGAAVCALAAIDPQENTTYILRSCMTLLRKDRENDTAIRLAIRALADMGATGTVDVGLLVELIVYPERCPCVRERVDRMVREAIEASKSSQPENK